jgi:hypothetical protein
MRVGMAVLVPAMNFCFDQIDFAVSDPALGHHRVGKLAHRHAWPAQNDRLDAVIVVEMGVHGRYGQVVVGVL